MGALAVGAEPVERRDAQSSGEVAVAAAAGQRHVSQLLADLAIDRLRFLEQRRDAGVLLIGRPVHAALDRELDVLADRLEGQEPVHHLLGELLARHTQVDLGRALGRHDVDAGAAIDQPDVAGDAAGIVGLGLDADDLPRHLGDGAAAILVAHAGVARGALHLEGESPDALARGDDLVAVAAGLHDQRVLVAARCLLDAGPRGRAADLLLGDEQEGDRQLGLLALPDQVAQRVIGDVAAGLHVVDAGAEDAVAFAAHLELLLDHADRMDRVEMGQHQDALTVAGAPFGRRLALQDVAEAVDARDALELQPEIAELAFDVIDHLVDRPGVMAGAFDRHPFDDARQDVVGLDLRFVLARLGHEFRTPRAPLTLRSERSERLEGWAAVLPLPPFETPRYARLL